MVHRHLHSRTDFGRGSSGSLGVDYGITLMFHNCIIPSSIFANPNGTETGGSSFLRELDHKERREKCACSCLEVGWMEKPTPML